MSMKGLNLILPEKADPERDKVADAWRAAGGTVTRIGRFWDPPEIDPGTARIYANDTFALVLAQKLNLDLISPRDDLLLALAPEWVGRKIMSMTLDETDDLAYPIFAKPAVPKLFKAAVYADHAALQAESRGLEADTVVLVSEIVAFECEARCFVLDGAVCDVAAYEGKADLADAWALALQVAGSGLLPAACVVDVGLIEGRGWVVIEANAAWGAGLNGCAAEKVMPCIAAATRLSGPAAPA